MYCHLPEKCKLFDICVGSAKERVWNAGGVRPCKVMEISDGFCSCFYRLCQLQPVRPTKVKLPLREHLLRYGPIPEELPPLKGIDPEGFLSEMK